MQDNPSSFEDVQETMLHRIIASTHISVLHHTAPPSAYTAEALDNATRKIPMTIFLYGIRTMIVTQACPAHTRPWG